MTKESVVTGGASGIGLAIARRFAARGDRVWLLDRDATAVAAAVSSIQQAGGQAEALVSDVSDTAAMQAALSRPPRVDVLVCSAGIAHIGNVVNTGPEDLDRLYQVNVKGVYHALHFAVPRMVAQGGGSIVNLASIASKLGIADRFAYSMTKGAVLSMTLSVARDYVGQGIRCNCICPARIHTPFVDGYLAKNYPGKEQEMYQKLAAYQPMGRMGTPMEVAETALYLCSDASRFVTGQAIPLDGGKLCG